MIIATSIYICINLILILRHMKHEPKHERLPWILFLCSVIGTIPGLVIYILSDYLLNTNNFSLGILARIFSLCMMAGPMIAGFLLEAFKPSWRGYKTRWWLVATIPIILAFYCCLVFILDNDGSSFNDMAMMIDFGVLVLLPFLASIFPLSKAPDKDNLKIYRLISAGFGLMVLSLVVVMTYYSRDRDLGFMIIITYFVSLTMIAYATNLKRLQAEERKRNGLG